MVSAHDPAQTDESSFCNLLPVCCNVVSGGGKVYKCFFLCRGRLSRWSSLSLSSRTITSSGSDQCEGQCWLCPLLVSSKSWCFASFCFVGVLTTFNFATAVCEQHPTTNYIGHKTKRWQQLSDVNSRQQQWFAHQSSGWCRDSRDLAWHLSISTHFNINWLSQATLG